MIKRWISKEEEIRSQKRKGKENLSKGKYDAIEEELHLLLLNLAGLIDVPVTKSMILEKATQLSGEAEKGHSNHWITNFMDRNRCEKYVR